MSTSVSRSSNKPVLSLRRLRRQDAAGRRRIGAGGPAQHYFIIASDEAAAGLAIQRRVKRRHECALGEGQ